MKTTAQITVFCPHPSDDILNWATEGRLKLESRTLRSCDTIGGRLFSSATEQAEEDDWTSPISPGLESAQSIEVEAIDVPSTLRARSYLYATSSKSDRRAIAYWSTMMWLLARNRPKNSKGE